MKEKTKKFLTKLKKALPLLVACLISGAIILGVFLLYKNSNKPFHTLASADEVSTVAAGPDLTKVNTGWNAADYPTANLIAHPYAQVSIDNSYTSSGITFTEKSDGSISVVGTATGIGYCKLSNVNLVAGTKYTLSAGAYSANAFIYVQRPISGETYSASNGIITFTAKNTATYEVYITVKKGITINSVYYPMLNAGETAYPYQPPFDLIWKDGYTEAESLAQYGIFSGATVNGTLTGAYVDDTETTTKTVQFTDTNPALITNGVDLSYFSTVANDLAPYGWNKTQLTFNLKTPVLSNDIVLFGAGNSTTFLGSFYCIDESGNRYSCLWNSVENQTDKVLVCTVDNVRIKKFLMIFGGGADGLGSTVTQGEISYFNGYDEGYGVGYNTAYNTLKEEAENEVLTDKETFLDGLFSIVDAPIKALREAFNFEVLGFNVSQLILFVLTIIVFVFVIKKLKGEPNYYDAISQAELCSAAGADFSGLCPACAGLCHRNLRPQL